MLSTLNVCDLCLRAMEGVRAPVGLHCRPSYITMRARIHQPLHASHSTSSPRP
uniref:S1-P1 nuclease n=1 Tax=Siphoviridae sp. ctQ091 TaxID=2825490 RepID=A0A8S5NVP8_9CAUD|nr:MAG TPA: S1-P1 nuclease [Siphoviridae sp. ctQ091]